MNCDECKNLISALMDNELDGALSDEVRHHLALCDDCAKVCADFTSILDFCATESPSDIVPPNSKAMWCRINNILESEVKKVDPTPEPPRRRLWQFSFSQVAAGLLFVGAVSSLLTVAAIRNYTEPRDTDWTTRSAANRSTFEKVLSKVGLTETPQQARERRTREQHAAIEYWNIRVQDRRQQWDRMTREAFDRNLQVIEESVNEYTMILEQDPDDELSGEMLDTVLNDKMNLLRDFSDL